MAELASTTEHTDAPPVTVLQMLGQLRQLLPDASAQRATVMDRWGLRALGGGRNNDVYLWSGPTGEVCIKLYRKIDDRCRCEREWQALSLLAEHGFDYAPTPLWRDHHSHRPAIGMSLVPGTPITMLADTARVTGALTGMARATRAMHVLPLAGLFARLDRVDSAQHYVTRLTDIWPGQLADHAAAHPHDRLTADMLALLRQWEARGDAAVLRQPAAVVFSRGDANLLNWHHHGQRVYCVDFEYAGRGDTAVDAADLTEHLSARAIPNHTWHTLEDELGINRDNRARFTAAQRTFALRWLAVLWKQRTQRPDEFAVQQQRVRELFD